MRILITGGAGYIGSSLVNFLLPQHEVVVYDSLLYDKTSLLSYVTKPNFKFVKGDVRNFEKLKQELKKADIIIPLAAIVGFPLCEKLPKEANEVNYEANKWIANNKSKEQLVIYPCTNSGYGTTNGNLHCTEESPLNPITLYGKTKVLAESAFKEVENYITFRLATVFGPSPRMRRDLLVNDFVWRARKEKLIVLFQEHFMRNYIHIEDVCNAFKYVIDNWDSCKNETYNVGNDSLNMNKLDLAKKIKQHMPMEIIRAQYTEDPDLRNYIVSSEKIYKKGFICYNDLDTGIKQLIGTYDMIDVPNYANS